MEIREYSIYDETEILRLYQSVGWTAYTDHPEVLRKGFENSMLILAAYEGDQLCGIIRTVGDGHTQIFFFYGFYNHSLELRRISFVWYSFWHNKTPHLLDSISYLSNKWGAVHREPTGAFLIIFYRAAPGGGGYSAG